MDEITVISCLKAQRTLDVNIGAQNEAHDLFSHQTFGSLKWDATNPDLLLKKPMSKSAALGPLDFTQLHIPRE